MGHRSHQSIARLVSFFPTGRCQCGTGFTEYKWDDLKHVSNDHCELQSNHWFRYIIYTVYTNDMSLYVINMQFLSIYFLYGIITVKKSGPGESVQAVNDDSNQTGTSYVSDRLHVRPFSTWFSRRAWEFVAIPPPLWIEYPNQIFLDGWMRVDNPHWTVIEDKLANETRIPLASWFLPTWTSAVLGCGRSQICPTHSNTIWQDFLRNLFVDWITIIRQSKALANISIIDVTSEKKVS